MKYPKKAAQMNPVYTKGEITDAGAYFSASAIVIFNIEVAMPHKKKIVKSNKSGVTQTNGIKTKANSAFKTISQKVDDTDGSDQDMTLVCTMITETQKVEIKVSNPPQLIPAESGEIMIMAPIKATIVANIL